MRAAPWLSRRTCWEPDFFADRTVSSESSSVQRCAAHCSATWWSAARRARGGLPFPNVYYVPENADFHTREGFVRWPHGDGESRLPLRTGAVYFLPSGFRVQLQKQLAGYGMAPGWLAAARHAVPQAMYGIAAAENRRFRSRSAMSC